MTGDSITHESIETIAQQYDKHYRNVSAARQIRRAVAKFNCSLDGIQKTSSERAKENDDSVEENYAIDSRNSVNLQLRQISHKVVIASHAQVKNPCSFNAFNRFMAMLTCIPCEKSKNAAETLLRDVISTIGNDYLYEVEYADGEFDLILESKVHRHSVNLHLQTS